MIGVMRTWTNEFWITHNEHIYKKDAWDGSATSGTNAPCGYAQPRLATVLPFSLYTQVSTAHTTHDWRDE